MFIKISVIFGGYWEPKLIEFASESMFSFTIIDEHIKTKALFYFYLLHFNVLQLIVLLYIDAKKPYQSGHLLSVGVLDVPVRVQRWSFQFVWRMPVIVYACYCQLLFI